MIAPIDTKVSIGTFVQLIRILISGSIKKSGRICPDRAGEDGLQSVGWINALCRTDIDETRRSRGPSTPLV